MRFCRSFQIASILSIALSLILLCPALAFLGTQLEDAKKRDFFSFFHLLESGRADGDGGSTVVTFRPLQSEKFKDLATVNATIDKSGKILAIDLLLSRSFIDDRMNGIFARDMAGSFISSVATPADGSAVKDLVNEIKFPKDTGGLVMLTRSAPPKLPEQPTDGYSTFLGKRKQFEQALAGSTLKMGNEGGDNEEVFRLSVTPR